MLRDAELGAEEGLRRSCAQADNDVWLNHLKFLLEPRHARAYLARSRLFVDAPLPTHLELEVLHRIRKVYLVARDPGALERLVEEATGRSYERPPPKVLGV